MANKNQKWTQELRMIFYSRLVCEFGPHAGWETIAYPHGRRERFEAVLKELAVYFSSRTGKSFEWTALEQQKKWGITRQGRVKNAGFAYQYILNKAAALETGFITSRELSGFVHIENDGGGNAQDPKVVEDVDEIETVGEGVISDNDRDLLGDILNKDNDRIEKEIENAETSTVFSIGFEGGGLKVTQYRTPGGMIYFRTSGRGMTLNDNGDEDWAPWQDVPTASFEKSLADLRIGTGLLWTTPLIVDQQYVEAVRGHIQRLLDQVTKEERDRMRDRMPAHADQWLSRLRRSPNANLEGSSLDQNAVQNQTEPAGHEPINEEAVFTVAFFGEGYEILRYRDPDGNTWFRSCYDNMFDALSLHDDDDEAPDYERKNPEKAETARVLGAPRETFREALRETGSGVDLLYGHLILIHPDFRDAVRGHIESLLELVSDEQRRSMGESLPATVDDWFARQESSSVGSPRVPTEINEQLPPALTGTNDFDAINEYGHHFDGYERFGGPEGLARVAGKVFRRYEENARWVGTIEELRGALYFMLRQQRHWGHGPEEGLTLEIQLPGAESKTVNDGPDLKRMEQYRTLYNVIRSRWEEVGQNQER